MAKEETNLHRIARIMQKPEFIRNIATSAHIHHGKCISGESRLILSNGTIKKAKDIFDEVSAEGKIYEENEDYTIFIPNKEMLTFSFNKETGKIEKKPIQYAWRLKGGNTIKIGLRNGFKITTTPEHKYVVYRDGLKEIESKDLKIGDRFFFENKEGAIKKTLGKKFLCKVR